MALILTKDQETALIALADREIASAPLRKALSDAEVALADVEQRQFAELEVKQLAVNAELNAITSKYTTERSLHYAELEAAKAALAALEASAVEVTP